MDRRLRPLEETTFDLLVVGGGAVGAAAAREGALRGLKVALVEAEDFGSGTTGATTRLAHGGLRYLEQYDVGQVREGLRERAWLLSHAPHLVKPLPFLFPLGPGRRTFAWKLGAGLTLYDRLAPAGLPRHGWFNGPAARAQEPVLKSDVARAATFYDAQILHPERLVLEFALAAAQRGAVIANHAEVTGLTRDTDLWRATVRDTLAGASVDVRARIVLNCAGPWVERLAGLAGVRRPLMRTTRGAHVAFPGFLRRALILRAADGRTFFAIPWNEVTLVGTTDLDERGDPRSVVASREEVAYLLREASAFMDLDGHTPAYTTAGVRAMVHVEGVRPGQVPRGHTVIDHARDGAPGFLSVVGGKLTTLHATGADAIHAVAHALVRYLPPGPDEPLPGARAVPPGGPAICGRHASLGAIHRATGEEWALTLTDFMLRRSLAGHAPDFGDHCVGAVAKALGSELGWDAARSEVELRAWEKVKAQRRAGLDPA